MHVYSVSSTHLKTPSTCCFLKYAILTSFLQLVNVSYDVSSNALVLSQARVECKDVRALQRDRIPIVNRVKFSLVNCWSTIIM